MSYFIADKDDLSLVAELMNFVADADDVCLSDLDIIKTETAKLICQGGSSFTCDARHRNLGSEYTISLRSHNPSADGNHRGGRGKGHDLIVRRK